MKRIVRKIVKKTKELLATREFLSVARRSAKAFTRLRKLPVNVVVGFLLASKKRSLQLEIDDLCEIVYEQWDAVGKDAMVKARQKLNPEAIKMLYTETVKTVMEEDALPRFKGYRIYAIDGSHITLPATHDICGHFGEVITGQTQASARMSYLCEVGTGYIMDASLDSYHIDERTQAIEHLDVLKRYGGDHDLILFDRGYPSKALMKHLEENGQYYLMRVSKSFDRQVDEQEEPEDKIEMACGSYKAAIRVIKVPLSTGEIETLLTNLPEAEFPYEAFADLYIRRWAIETGYDLIKNTLQLENVTGKTHLTVLQDFYATCYLGNLVAAIAAEAQADLAEPSKVYKHEHKVNKNLIAGRMKKQFLQLILLDDIETAYNALDRLVQQAVKNYCVLSSKPPPPRSSNDSHHKRSQARKRAF